MVDAIESSAWKDQEENWAMCQPVAFEMTYKDELHPFTTSIAQQEAVKLQYVFYFV